MCVWQLQAPGGTSKATGVAGCAALPGLMPVRASRPTPIVAVRTLPRLNIVMAERRPINRADQIVVLAAVFNLFACR